MDIIDRGVRLTQAEVANHCRDLVDANSVILSSRLRVAQNQEMYNPDIKTTISEILIRSSATIHTLSTRCNDVITRNSYEPRVGSTITNAELTKTLNVGLERLLWHSPLRGTAVSVPVWTVSYHIGKSCVTVRIRLATD